ncbi:MAG: hypothetical protein WBH10_02025 [Allopontixanthobacter sediminis]
MIAPVAGRRFVCLDDPEAIDSRRMRLDLNAAEDLTGLRVVSPRSGVPTLAADGASLICEEVSIAKGKRLVFAWHFMVWGDLPWNDFATFQAIPANPPSYGLSRHVLCDLAEMAMGGKRASGWLIATWTLTDDFAGTLLWTVANGQEVSDPTLLEPAEEAFANPPCLLIDDIRIFDS